MSRPGGLQAGDRRTDVVDQLGTRPAGAVVDLVPPTVDAALMSLDHLAPSGALDRPPVAVGVARQVRDDVTARPAGEP